VDTDVRLGPRGGCGSISMNEYGSVAAAVERRAVGKSDVRGSGNRPQTRHELVVERRHRILPHADQVEPHREHPLGVETGADPDEVCETPDHEPRASQQDDGQRDLDDRQGVATR